MIQLPPCATLTDKPVPYTTLFRSPAMDPARYAVPQRDAVRVDADLDRTLQRLQPADRCHQLHAVVGRRRLAAVQLLLPPPIAQDDAPAAGAWIDRKSTRLNSSH